LKYCPRCHAYIALIWGSVVPTRATRPTAARLQLTIPLTEHSNTQASVCASSPSICRLIVAGDPSHPWSDSLSSCSPCPKTSAMFRVMMVWTWGWIFWGWGGQVWWVIMKEDPERAPRVREPAGLPRGQRLPLGHSFQGPIPPPPGLHLCQVIVDFREVTRAAAVLEELLGFLDKSVWEGDVRLRA
jgi:hypothetical protein